MNANTNSSQNSEAKAIHVSNSDEDEWSGVVECAAVERTKSERSARGEENRRRRTIIVEKKNGTYGFTLQSYGIHYKREQEIEMVTYVDYVEFDGPAFKAGMREGDVILSINGQEMDRADHKTLVNFIKNCDTRMRMVVSFEDCVRKVELHMRYIELQRALQSRLSKLERLCEQERSILMGKWKTHSLPARKRTPNDAGSNSSDQPSPSSNFSSANMQCCRPAASTEHLLLYNVYADGRSFLIPRSAACLVAVGPPRSRSDHYHFLSKSTTTDGGSTNASSRHSYHQANGLSNTPSKSKTHKSTGQQSCEPQGAMRSGANSLCVACISSAARRRENADGGSLDAYDLASPCCDPNCVPSRRRRDKQKRVRNDQSQQQHAQQQQQKQHGSHNCPRSSDHSLHSITSSDMSTTVDSVASCSTSLSTDTLYWDPNVQQRPPQQCLQYAKPKSWDNLTTKAFGGYGFGYGYIDTATIKSHNNERSSKHGRSKTSTISSVPRRSSSTNTGYSSSGSRHFQPTKSTESLLVPTQYQVELDGSLSCECLDGHNARFITVQLEKHKRQDNGYGSGSGGGGGSHSQVRHRRSSHSEGKLRATSNSEATRL